MAVIIKLKENLIDWPELDIIIKSILNDSDDTNILAILNKYMR